MVSLTIEVLLSSSFSVDRAILHDENRYPDPEAFEPNRFLTPDGQLDPTVPDPGEAFGYGRRICPGRHFAHDVLFLVMASILAGFSIEKPIDDKGHPIEPRVGFSGGTFRCVFINLFTSSSCADILPCSGALPFDARFIPRFPEAAELIKNYVPMD